MSSDILKEFSGADEFQQSLGQIRDGRRECETFFDDALKRLELTLNEAVREQHDWEEQRVQTQSELDEQATELERRRQELQSQREHFFNETLVATQEQFQQRFDELLARNSQSDHSAGELESRLKEMEEERTNLLQGRSVLEAELETLRQRAAELMGTIEEQKHAAGERQNQLNEELQRQRQVLELVLQRLVGLESLAAATARTNEFAAQMERADADGDSVLSSVMSQFEVLQKDVARRRNETAG